ncbi:carbamoyl-phosphate synthase large subunit [bacterium]|nr:carbamoyl-phosphate synthase large subunit [bacterium]
MPKRNDIHKILIIGSGPIVIGQACEFDYSGTQAVKALNELGYETVLVNSNPATIMTDRDLAGRTYIEPINRKTVAKIIRAERPDALLPTMGGQTSLNVTVELAERGILEEYGVELIGANLEAIKKAEDRELFKEAMLKLGLQLPRGGFARTMDEAMALIPETGFPAIIRPAFTLGGAGGSIAYNKEEYRVLAENGIMSSPIHEILVEESVIGWKEYELEVMRDQADNVVIVCSVENVDPMGVHTGDSVTVAPVQTLSDREYQYMRDAAIAIIREIGVDTGGSNIQFAVNPADGRMVVVEMNPRVSRSSALASKATGFPIAKIAARLAVGLTLDEITNDITGKTPACFEPALDYVIVKIPRWNFEKFPQAEPSLSTQMKSVGETMAIGRTFGEAFQKALRSLENGYDGLDESGTESLDDLRKMIKKPTPLRLFQIARAFRMGMTVDECGMITGIDPWFLARIDEIVQQEEGMTVLGVNTPEALRQVKRMGFSDRRIARLTGMSELAVRRERYENGILPVFKAVDTCAAEFAAETSYLYSTYEQENESRVGERPRVIILGSGPNRIGQGIEFDYCCVHAVLALQELGYETIMINNNPETVSTDYDTADKLYFEPLTLEDVLHITDLERPEGVIVQFGGQTPLKLAAGLEKAGVPIMGTSPESIDCAEDRRRFGELISGSAIRMAPWGTAYTFEEAKKIGTEIGYPVIVRPSYVLGGRGMEIVYDEEELETYIRQAADVSPEHPVLVDKFLEDAFEFDVDAICDGEQTIICGCMQHIEEAGVHSGDSSCVIPPYMLSDDDYSIMRDQAGQLAGMLQVRGLMNIQFALYAGAVYVLEVNPRASRTVPFVSKATGVPWAKVAAKVMAGHTLKELGVEEPSPTGHVAVKTPVFPFMKFPNVQTYLSPEMRSTGEVMGIDTSFGGAFAKAQFAAGHGLPKRGTVFISVNDRDKSNILPIARQLYELGFGIRATRGTHQALKRAGIPSREELKIGEGRPNIADSIINGDVQLVINTPMGKIARSDEYNIGRVAIAHDVPCLTTLSASWAAVQAIRTLQARPLDVCALQDLHSSG